MTAAANDASSRPHSSSSGQSHDYLVPYHRETRGGTLPLKKLYCSAECCTRAPAPPKHLVLLVLGSTPELRRHSSFPSLNPQTLPFLCFAPSPPFPISTRRAPTSTAIGTRLFCLCHLWQSRSPRCCRRLSPRSRCNPLAGRRERERATEGTAAIKQQQHPPRHSSNNNFDPLQPCPTSSKRAPASFTGA